MQLNRSVSREKQWVAERNCSHVGIPGDVHSYNCGGLLVNELINKLVAKMNQIFKMFPIKYVACVRLAFSSIWSLARQLVKLGLPYKSSSCVRRITYCILITIQYTYK